MVNVMKKFFLLIFALFFAISAYAVPASRESVEKLFTVMQIQASIDDQFSESAKEKGPLFVHKIIADLEEKNGGPLSSEKRAKVEAFGEKFMAEMVIFLRAELTLRVKEEYIKDFSEVLSQDEVDSLVSYYSTPIGRSAKAKVDQVNTKVSLKIIKDLESDAFSKKMLEEIMPKIMPELISISDLIVK